MELHSIHFSNFTTEIYTLRLCSFIVLSKEGATGIQSQTLTRALFTFVFKESHVKFATIQQDFTKLKKCQDTSLNSNIFFPQGQPLNIPTKYLQCRYSSVTEGKAKVQTT